MPLTNENLRPQVERADSAVSRTRRSIIAICDGEWNGFFPPGLREELLELLPELQWIKPDQTPEAEWHRLLAEHDPEIIISGWSTSHIPESYYRSGCSLKYMCHLTGSVRTKVARYCIEDGLVVTNWGNSISHSVAEHSLLLALCGLRYVSYYAVELHAGRKPAKMPLRSLSRKRVGIHGFGWIARELIRLLKSFNTKISVYSPESPNAQFDEYGVTRCTDLMDLFADNDVLFELEGLTPRTLGMVKEPHLRAMKKGSVFVNCGRAGLVEEAGLIAVAKEGNIAIGLDVFHQEPLPLDYPLRGLPNVTLTPHVAGPPPESLPDCGRFALENLRRFVEGREVIGRVTPAHYDNMT